MSKNQEDWSRHFDILLRKDVYDKGLPKRSYHHPCLFIVLLYFSITKKELVAFNTMNQVIFQDVLKT